MESARKLFTTDDVLRMVEAGLFGPEERIELIDGEIIEMSPVGDRHIMCVNRATAFFVEALGRTAVVTVQNAVHLNIRNMPRHDLILVYRDPVGSRHRTQLKFRRGDSIFPLAFPNSTFRVDDLIGEEPSY